MVNIFEILDIFILINQYGLNIRQYWNTYFKTLKMENESKSSLTHIDDNIAENWFIQLLVGSICYGNSILGLNCINRLNERVHTKRSSGMILFFSLIITNNWSGCAKSSHCHSGNFHLITTILYLCLFLQQISSN